MLELSQYIDHTLLKSDSTVGDVELLCKEAIHHNFYAVCINSCHVALAKSILNTTKVSIASTVGFPLGAVSKDTKIFEALQAAKDGAQEIDMVINVGYLKSGMYREVVDDMRGVKQALGKDIIVKVIFENTLLDITDIQLASKLAVEAGVDFIKTSTGFQTGSIPNKGAQKHEVEVMLNEVRDHGVKVKAAGGIKDYNDAIEFIRMGVQRIGTSASIHILNSKSDANDLSFNNQEQNDY